VFDTAKIGASPPLLEWLSVILLGWPPQRGRGHRIADKRLETPERVLHGAIRHRTKRVAIALSPKSRCAPSPGSYNRLALHGRHHTVPAVTPPYPEVSSR
jgi:hypothetical protein